MDDSCRDGCRELRGEPPCRFVDRRQLAGSVQRPELGEPPYLTLEVDARAHERGERRLGEIGGVDLGEHRDEIVGKPCARVLALGERRRQAVGDHSPVDEVHDVERNAETVGVLADRAHHGDANAGGLERQLQSRLACDVVCRVRVRRARRAAEDEPLVPPLDQEGEVRAPLANGTRAQLTRPSPASSMKPARIRARGAAVARAARPRRGSRRCRARVGIKNPNRLHQPASCPPSTGSVIPVT